MIMVVADVGVLTVTDTTVMPDPKPAVVAP